MHLPVNKKWLICPKRELSLVSLPSHLLVWIASALFMSDKAGQKSKDMDVFLYV